MFKAQFRALDSGTSSFARAGIRLFEGQNMRLFDLSGVQILPLSGIPLRGGAPHVCPSNPSTRLPLAAAA